MNSFFSTFRKTAVLVFLLFPILAYALDGRVVSVIDGDTIYVLTKEKKRIKIRLSSIDSVEKSQPLGKKAKKALSNLIYGQYVHIEEQPNRDRWKRVLGTVYIDGVFNVNREMVALGYAWVYTRYNTDDKLPGIQSRAKKEKKGIWALPEELRIEPWVWRGNVRQSKR